MKKSLWLILILVIIVALLYLGFAEKIMIAYYANKTGQETDKVEQYFDKVEEYAEKVKQEIDNFDYRVELARAYEYAGNIDKAIEIYEEYSDKVSDDIFFLYHNNLGKLYEKKEEHQTAIDHYTKIIEKFGDQYPRTYINLANSALDLEDKESAINYYLKFRTATDGAEDSALQQRLN
ncbi:MAG: tetratricopeptide repeat protein [bacterium]